MKNKSLSWIPLEAGLKLDSDQKILYGVQVAMLGEAKGHGFELDDMSLDKIVELGNAKPEGIKVRFGHPSMCSPALGTFLGVRKNFRRDGEYVRADLYMSEAADASKAEHVLKMAKYEPAHIGNSVVINAELEERLDANGSVMKDEDGDDMMPVVRPYELLAVDVVDEPASGNGMFAAPVEDVELSARTVVELRDAMAKPGFLRRALDVLSGLSGSQDSPVVQTADSDVSAKEVSMELTLSKLLEEYPAVAAEHAAKLSAEKETELATATETGAVAERARIVSFLSQCKPFHFSKTAAHPKGFVLHAIESGLSEVECLRGLLELSSKAQTLSTLERESADLPVESAEPADKQLSAADVKRAELLAAVEAHNQKGGA
jgi:hypothetical protein